MFKIKNQKVNNQNKKQKIGTLIFLLEIEILLIIRIIQFS